jgi:uncharacterized protein involved in copper resistance
MRGENQSAAAKIAVKDSSDFIKALGQVDPETRAQIKSMQTNKDGTPSQMQLQALGLAQETEKQSKENEKTQAEIEAMQRGDHVTTTVTDKGVTKRFVPPKPDKSASSEPVELKEQDIGGKKFIVNPKTGRFVEANKSDKEITVQELHRAYSNQNTSETDKNSIRDYVLKHFPKQAVLFGATNAPEESATSPKVIPPTGQKVGRFIVNPE